MLGWAPPAFGLMERESPPEISIDEWRRDRVVRNASITARCRSTGDRLLDLEAFAKPIAEVSAGVALGPFCCLEEVLVKDPRLAQREGIWEAHGDATQPSVRNIHN